MSKPDPGSITQRLRTIVLGSLEGSTAARRVVPFRSREAEAEEGRVEPPLPERYEIRDSERGRFLHCQEAPGVAVSIERTHAYSEAEARKLGERLIFLDGAGQFGPLLDNARQLYNLDHHEDCVRAFTLATCEQALVLVVKGLELDKGDWTIYANEPDLDTVFAIWILLNHRRVRDMSPQARDTLLPLLRLEGAIDANGSEVAQFCGLPEDLLRESKAKLDRLLASELELKRSGKWSKMDLAWFTLTMLQEVDKLVYTSGDFSDFTSVDREYGHVDIGAGRVAVICRDASGIYEVEKRLKKIWGERLGIVALEKEPNHYTLRRSASLTDIDLEHAYDKLNLLDPVVDGRPPEKRWGGSDDIGGSPRPSGTALAPQRIVQVLGLAYQTPHPLAQLKQFALALVTTGVLAGAGALASILWGRFAGGESGSSAQLAVLLLVAGLGSWGLSPWFSGDRRWLFGWQAPAGRDWILLVPVVLLGAVGGGVWVPARLDPGLGSWIGSVSLVLLAGLVLEIWFRGLVHGLLILDWPVQTVGGRWFVSRPTLFSAFLYTLVTLAVSPRWLAPLPVPALGSLGGLLPVAGFTLLTGVALGMMRERSLSLWPGIGAQIVGATLLLLLGA